MTIPLSAFEQANQARFVPDTTLLVLFGMSKYTHVWTRNGDGELKQALNNIPHAKQKCEQIKQVIRKYNVKQEDIYGDSNNPTSKQWTDIMSMVSARLRSGSRMQPPQKYLVLYAFVGNGIVKDGRFCMLINEYDLSTRYYKMFRAEEKIRSWA